MALEKNDVTFSRPDFHLIQICQMLCSSSILVRSMHSIGLPMDGGSQYRCRGGKITVGSRDLDL